MTTWQTRRDLPKTLIGKSKHKAIFTCCRCKKKVPWRYLSLARTLPDGTKLRYPWCFSCEAKRLRRKRLKKFLIKAGQEKALERLGYQRELLELFEELYKKIYMKEPRPKSASRKGLPTNTARSGVEVAVLRVRARR